MNISDPLQKPQIITSFENKERIIIQNPIKLKTKLKSIQSMGKEEFSLFSDFDFTLTAAKLNGLDADSSFSVLTKSDLISDKYKKEMHDLFQQFSPFENSCTISRKQKKQLMNIWWSKSQKCILEEGITALKIRNSIRNSCLAFRNGIKEFLNYCSSNTIPLYIVSAGLGCIIKESFEMIGIHLNNKEEHNFKLVCTEEKYENNGILYGFSKPMMTSQNKSKILKSIQGVNNRANACVIGDLISDLDMIKDLNFSHKFSIGYFNSNSKGNDPFLLEDYVNSFDIVIMNEGSLNCITFILQKLFGYGPCSENISSSNRELIEMLFE